MVPPYSDRISRVPPYLSQAQYHTGHFHVRGYHPLWPAFPSCSVMSCAITCRLLRFRSPLLSESRLMSFPRATEMFQFTRFASHTYVFSMRYPLGGFPHSEISGSKLICQLPEAYRRLSRLSSPIIAKASTMCSYSLDPITLTLLSKPLIIIKECLTVFHLSRYAVIQFRSSITRISNVKFDIRFDAIKNSVANNHARHGLH